MRFTAEHLRATFAEPGPMTLGLEEEVMLLDPVTLDLAPRAREVLGRLDGDPRYTLELPAAQLEIVLPPASNAAEAARLLGAARRRLAEAVDGELRCAAAGVHPFTDPVGVLNEGERYERIAAQYGDAARMQLVFSQHVHVAVRGADRALAVYNALRGELPLVAALAANAPLHAGRDTRLASVRPALCELLPRQGVPPLLRSWEEHAANLARIEDPMRWWWELRPHPVQGTLEIRVPDAQASVADAAAVAAVVHALVAWLAERFDAGETLPAPPTPAVEEDRALASRFGAAAGSPLQERVLALLDAIGPAAARQGAERELAHARRMVLAGGGAQRLRAAFAARGARGAVDELAARFTGD